MGYGLRWRARSLIRGSRRRLFGFPFVPNANRVDPEGYSKRALLIYLVDGVLLRTGDAFFRAHHNLHQARQLATLLDRLGYVVDVADHRTPKPPLTERYDLVISHRVDYTGFQSHLTPDARVLYLASGMEYGRHNRLLNERYDGLAERRGKIERRAVHALKGALPLPSASDAIAGFGNGATLASWHARYPRPTFPFNNYAYPDTVPIVDRDYATARRNFLFFASGPQVLKGLDLALEVFARRPELHVYVCSRFRHEPDFARCYAQELFHTPNIHPVGTVLVNGPRYRELVKACAYVLSLSCTEGQPGSIVQCMSSGLIPLVTPHTGLDAPDVAVPLPDTRLDALEEALVEASRIDPSALHARARRAVELARTDFSAGRFVARWSEILTDVSSAPSRRMDAVGNGDG